MIHTRPAQTPSIPLQQPPWVRGAVAGTAASLMLLIAACGGGGGGSSNDNNVSSSPDAPGTQAPAPDTGTPNQPSPGNGGNSGGNSGGGNGSGTNPGNSQNDTGSTNQGSQQGGGSSGQGSDQHADSSGHQGSDQHADNTGHDGDHHQPGQQGDGHTNHGSNHAGGNHDTAPAPTPVPPISAAGLSGDVLATMINQPGTHRPDDHMTPPSHPNAHIGGSMRPWFVDQTERWSAMPPAGQAVEHGSRLSVDQTVEAWAEHSHDRANDLSYRVQSFPFGHNTPAPIHPMDAKFQLSSPIDGFLARNVKTLAPAATADVGTELLRLKPTGSITIHDAADPTLAALKTTLMLDGQQAYVIRKGKAVPMNQVLHQWQGTGSVAQLMVKRGQNPDEAQLCLNVQTPKLGRLSCAIFQVPANWQLGQPLTRRGYLIVDERGHYPGESGKAYWYASPGKLPQHPDGY